MKTLTRLLSPSRMFDFKRPTPYRGTSSYMWLNLYRIWLKRAPKKTLALAGPNGKATRGKGKKKDLVKGSFLES